MKRTDFALFVAAGLAAGCTAEEPRAVVQSPVINCTSGPKCFEVSNAPNRDVACPTTRQVTVSPATDCPDRMPVWAHSKVFPGAAVAELARYCIYEFQGTGSPTQTHIDALPGTPKPDCDVVGAQGTQWEQTNAHLYEAAYFNQIEGLLNLPLTNSGLVPSRMLVVDSAVTGPFPDPQTGQLEHGQVMGEIGRKLGCPQGPGADCRVDVATVLALALERDPVTNGLVANQIEGGYLGRLSHTARAIVQAVDTGLSGPAYDNVVINLSLGWDPHWGGDLSGAAVWSDLPAPLRAVYSAVMYASCNGALVISAAGNNPGGPTSTPGAIFPAQWETEPAATTARCVDLGGQSIPVLGSYRPLVYAVGGVDGKDDTLMLEREGSRPRLVAPANHVAMTRVGVPHSGVHSGTSVAAAGVSGIAAAVWAYVPTLSGHEVMDIVHAKGVAVGHPVDFCNSQFGACPTETRRVSLCRSLRRACTLNGDCLTMPTCGPRNPGVNESVNGLDTSSPAPKVLNLATTLPVAVGSPCNTDVHTAYPEDLVNPCPGRQHHSPYVVPHLVPQPIINGCPTCGFFFEPDPRLLIGISVEAPDVLSDIKLVVINNGQHEIYDLYELNLEGEDLRGQYFEITNFPFTAGDIEKASIEFLVDHEYVASEPLSIEY